MKCSMKEDDISMETMKLEQLVQATSGLSNRKETPVFANGKAITEIRISIKDGAQCVDLVSAGHPASGHGRDVPRDGA